MPFTLATPTVERGVYESDAAPGCKAFVLYLDGERKVRIELSCAGAECEAITFLWRLLCARDPHLRLVD